MELRSVDLGGPVTYADYGGDGAPLVLVHGLAGSHVNWMAVGPELAASLHVYALDLVGFGRTPAAGRTASLAVNQSVVERFVEEVAGAPAFLVGHSMGGLIVLRVCAARPDLVRAAVLMGSVAPGEMGLESSQQALLLAVLDDIEAALPVVQAYATSMGPERLVDDSFGYMHVRPVEKAIRDAHVELEAERVKTPDSLRAYLEALQDLHKRRDDYEEFEALVRAVSAPVLVLHGLEDGVVPVGNMKRAAALRPDWDAVWLEGVGHNPQMEAPQEFLAAVTPFFSRPSGGPRRRTAAGASQ